MKIQHEELVKYRRRDMSVDQFIAFAAKKDPESRLNRTKLERMPAGSILAILQKEDGTRVRIHLKKIWITPYTLSYRNTKTQDGKARKGKELLISNFPISKKALRALPQA